MGRKLVGLLAALAMSVLPAEYVSAGDINFSTNAELTSVVERQNARLAELEAALASPDGCSSCGGCCQSCGCDPCCRPSGVIGGAEIAFLKPHHSRGIAGPIDTPDFDFSYEAAPRFWAGWQGSDGLGVRARYWEFDHAQSLFDQTVVPNDIHTVSYDTYLIDAEVFDSMSLGCYWDATVFAGFRYVEFSEQRTLADAATGVLNIGNAFANHGIGLTTGGELRRCIGCGLAGFVNGRASVLMGDQNEFAVANGNWFLVDRELDNIFYIWEAQAGVQWTRELERSGYLFARAAVEVQYWNNFSGEPFFDGGEAWGLGGFAFSAGVIR